MKKFFLFLFLIISYTTIFSQENISITPFVEEIRKHDGEQFLYHYKRTIALDTAVKNRLLVTFTFTTGDAPFAISYRQEAMSGKVEWFENQSGEYKKDKFVETITIKLSPEQQVTWQFFYTPKSIPKTGLIEIEKAALLLMDSMLNVSKDIFARKSFKGGN